MRSEMHVGWSVAALGWNKLAGALVVMLGVTSAAAPLVIGPAAVPLIAIATIVLAACQAVQWYYGRPGALRGSALLDAVVALAIAAMLILSPALLLNVVAYATAGFFAISGIGRLVGAYREWGRQGASSALLLGIGEMALAALLAMQWPISGVQVVAVIVGFHILVAGASLYNMPTRKLVPETPAEMSEHPDERLGLAPSEHVADIRARVVESEALRRPIDRYWQISLLVIFFAIHVGRMRADFSLVSLISPFAATIGDLLAAIFVGVLLMFPGSMGWRSLTRRVERGVWRRYQQAQPASRRARVMRVWLTHRMRVSERIGRARASVTFALHRSMDLGLPVVAVIIATAPIWGFNWYFNSENWATAVWERWAEHRTEAWRGHMIDAVTRRYGDPDGERIFHLAPPGLDAPDFSFVVIGDPGEGDASQLVLKDQILHVTNQPECRFLVISSDVVYPAGAMIDYEPNFYLPFKGVTKPIFAIPGNHDWFDALEAFNANFLEPLAAREAMHARLEADHRISATTDRRIDQYIADAGRLRRHYQLNTAHQRGPFFEIHTEGFSLIAIDTGISRRVDERQLDWVRGALIRAGENYKFVILGHPLYAGGVYQGAFDSEFEALHDLFRAHGVNLVMAGDTHTFEYYREPPSALSRGMDHFVNGGGGAYLSIGTALAWPGDPAVADYAFYPTREQIISKLAAETPRWKWPMWLWVRHLRAWPLSQEAMAGAFDYNSAPFYQSFVEVRVERSSGVVRVRPYGVNGRLRWRDLHFGGRVIPDGTPPDAPVEFVSAFPDGAFGGSRAAMAPKVK